MGKETYYDTLGVGQTATEDEIKQAYRKLAREYHPDVNDSPDAESRFKTINLAYATLSDSLKRADYDQTLVETGVKTEEFAGARPGAAGTAPTYTSPNRQAMFRAAYARLAVAALIAGVLGIMLQLAYGYAVEQPVSTRFLALGTLLAVTLGGFWGADLNFKVETFFGSGWMGRSYTFARTIVTSLGLAYFFGLVGAAIERVFDGSSGHVITLSFALVGILVGAVVGSDGDTPEKLRSGSGRFNLFYTLLRGAEVGLVTALVAAILGGILTQLGIPDALRWTVFIGFALGMIAGSIKPPNLAAYASYASASIKNVLVLLMVAGALLLGLVAGVLFAPQVSQIFGIS